MNKSIDSEPDCLGWIPISAASYVILDYLLIPFYVCLKWSESVSHSVLSNSLWPAMLLCP